MQQDKRNAQSGNKNENGGNVSIPITKLQKIGCLGLKRTVFISEGTRTIFYIDSPSLTTFSASALTLKMTTDELLRQMIWLFNNDDRVKKEVLLSLTSM